MFSSRNLTRQRVPSRIPFSAISDKILGPAYELSLVFIGHTRSRNLNRAHRGKDKPTNVLSFPLDNTMGEIFIDLRKTKYEAPKFARSFESHLAYLFIHGALHLKGFTHGSTMERKEQQLMNL
ncbi:MAG TPA: rRNA maturation RNase YbeY, partial [Candidatus Paceibacterota bacterium]|nr:rRNA maturation RNase YbeY [Candidatus Paceibacterota bacterium]